MSEDCLSNLLQIFLNILSLWIRLENHPLVVFANLCLIISDKTTRDMNDRLWELCLRPTPCPQRNFSQNKNVRIMWKKKVFETEISWENYWSVYFREIPRFQRPEPPNRTIRQPCTYGLLTKCEVKMAGYWPSSFFACLWTETKSRSINSQKKNEANIQPSW